jgi:DNA-binding transcriptional LysR family regulator
VAAAGEVELLRLAGERWIDNDFAKGRCRANLIEACQAAGFSPAFHVEAHDYPTALAFVDAGIGITVLPRLGAAALPAGVVAVPVTSPTPQRSIHALVQVPVADTPPVRRVVQVLRDLTAGKTLR